MRLRPADIKALVQALNPFLSMGGATLYLYGSRLDDTRKGGDIDLFLLVKNPMQAAALKKARLKIIVAIQDKMGEQKIDLSIITREEQQNDPFFQAISLAAKPVFSWSS